MADELTIFYPTGATLTAKVYPPGQAQEGSDVSLAEVGSTGYYAGDMPTVSAGVYDFLVLEGAAQVGEGRIVWDGSAEVTLNDLSTFDASTDEVTTDSASRTAAQANVSGLATAASIAALNDPTPAAIADAVWDEAQTGHNTPGTFGEYLDAAVSTRSDHSAPDLSNLDAAVSSRSSHAAPDLSTVNGFVADVTEDDGGTLRFTANALEEAPTGSGGGGGATAQQVWEYATRGLTEAVTTDAASRTASQANVSGLSTFDPVSDTVALTGTPQVNVVQVVGDALVDIDDLKADVSGLATASAVSAIPTTPLLAADYTAPLNSTQVQAATEAALAAYDSPTKAELDAAVATLINAAFPDASTNVSAGVATITFTDTRDGSTVTRTLTLTNDAGAVPANLAAGAINVAVSTP